MRGPDSRPPAGRRPGTDPAGADPSASSRRDAGNLPWRGRAAGYWVPSRASEIRSSDRPIEHTGSTYLEDRAAGTSPPGEARADGWCTASGPLRPGRVGGRAAGTCTFRPWPCRPMRAVAVAVVGGVDGGGSGGMHVGNFFRCRGRRCDIAERSAMSRGARQPFPRVGDPAGPLSGWTRGCGRVGISDEPLAWRGD